jgi:hypothetical protein
MTRRRKLEGQFERALLDVLEQDWDLEVRLPDDRLNRRRSRVATLRARYRWSTRGKATAILSIEGDAHSSHLIPVDFSSTESIEEAAEDCEALALSVSSWLDDRHAGELDGARAASGGRRWDD